MKLIDLPVKCSSEEYDEVKYKLLKRYSSNELVRSIYNIGSVSTPGISDIDFVFVFLDGSEFTTNPMDGMNWKEKYIMKHNPFGVCESHWQSHFKYSIINEYKGLHLKNGHSETKIYNSEKNSSVEVQTALEYILKFYISLTTQYFINIFKVRSLLLEIKSFMIDYKIINNEHSEFRKTLVNILDLREDWFNVPKRVKYFSTEILRFYGYLNEYVKEVFSSNIFFLPFPNEFKYLNNVTLNNGKPVVTLSRGLGRTIGAFGLKTNKFYNFANKFHKYKITLPWSLYSDTNSILYKKYVFEKEMYFYNLKHIRYFLPLKSPLHIFTNE